MSEIVHSLDRSSLTSGKSIVLIVLWCVVVEKSKQYIGRLEGEWWVEIRANHRDLANANLHVVFVDDHMKRSADIVFLSKKIKHGKVFEE